jgi:ubiquitin-protein ligase
VSLRHSVGTLITCVEDFRRTLNMLTSDTFHSASPLNNEAAQLHEKDAEEYQRKVLARHQDIDD